MKILGIDPGQKGALVLLSEDIEWIFDMPLTKQKDVDFKTLTDILDQVPRRSHVFLERAMPMAMGAKHAFNYGRSFAALEIALALSSLTVTYVEPMKWARVMHEGIDSDLKPKAKSRIALERLLPHEAKRVPRTKNGNYHEGVMEALLIAAYGRRILGHQPENISLNDF